MSTNDIKDNEKGAIMVEGVIYLPLAIGIVVFLLYIALMTMQEYLLMYEVQRVASVASKEIAYHGYENLGVGADDEIDFTSIPSDGVITSYYTSYTEGLKDIYREVGGLLRAAGVGSPGSASYAAGLGSALASNTLIAVGNITEPDIQINSGFFGSAITVTITHTLPVPEVFRYLGYKEGMQVKSSAYSFAINPSSFVRNVDLGVDLVSYIFEKLGLSGQFSDFKAKTSQVLNIIL